MDDVFWTTEPFVTKPCLMVHQHKPECLMKILKSQWLSEGSKFQGVIKLKKRVALFKVKAIVGVHIIDMTVAIVSYELWSFLLPNFDGTST